DVVAGRTPGRTDDVERNVADFDGAELSEPQRLVLRVFAVKKAARGVGREGGGQVENAEAGFVSADVGEQVAQALRAERFEAFGHQRATGRVSAPDVVLADREIAGRIAQQRLEVVLALDNAVVSQIVLRLEADADEIRLDQPVRVNDVHEQLARSVRAHAGEVGRKVAAIGFELMATGAVRKEKLVTILDVPRL